MSFSEWKSFLLKEICEYSSDRININKVTVQNYISTENMFPERSGVTLATTLPNAKSVIAYSKGNTLISNIRPYFKKIWYANKEGGASNDVLVFKCNEKIVDKKYLYYLLSQDRFFDYVMGTSKGTKMPRGDKNAILRYNVDLPTLTEQKYIANFLTSLDKKIETNNQINKKLEEMAGAIFKQWFVDFEFPNEDGEPYKSSGGEMVESEIGMIPKGWEVGKIGNVAKIVRGASPRPIQDFMSEQGMPWLKISDATSSSSKYISKIKEFIKEEGINKSRKVEPGTLVLSNSATPGMAKIMLLEACVHDGWLIFSDYKDLTKEFIYYYLVKERDKILSLSNGSVFRNLKTDILKSYPIIIPSKIIVDKCTEIFTSLDKDIENRTEENINLEELRDALLPRLMAGEIRVPLSNES